MTDKAAQIQTAQEAANAAETKVKGTHTETALESVFQSCLWWDSDLVYKISLFVLFSEQTLKYDWTYQN